MSNYGNARIGHKKGTNGNVVGYNKIRQVLRDLVDENVQYILEDEVFDLQDEIEEIANKELINYFKVVSDQMELVNKPKLNEDRKRGPYEFFTYNVFDRVVWFPLSERTRKIKRKRQGASAANVKWYSYNDYKKHGGEPLKKYLEGLAFDQYSCSVSVEKVDVDGKTGYKLHLNIPLDEDTIEAHMDEDQAAKAFGDGRGGINEERRPIFNPVAEYFIRQRIPRAIRDRLEGKDVKFS